MTIIKTRIPEVKIIEPDYFEDMRGYFAETYSARTFDKYGIDTVFVQENQSYSIARGTLRGIHFQNAPYAQTKLVRVLRGAIIDYAVDLRRTSPTYKQYVSVVLSDTNHKQFFVPKGFGHAVLTITDNVEILYKVDVPYTPEADRNIVWNDSEIGIDWGLNTADFIISAKDKAAPCLKNSDVNFE
jgi:dTDP-4-dehydrorhamnose reductase/dTDP-4-dehydrorhamnose 3,5-epimerase